MILAYKSFFGNILFHKKKSSPSFAWERKRGEHNLNNWIAIALNNKTKRF
jgi:hypothetical protein